MAKLIITCPDHLLYGEEGPEETITYRVPPEVWHMVKAGLDELGPENRTVTQDNLPPPLAAWFEE